MFVIPCVIAATDGGVCVMRLVVLTVGATIYYVYFATTTKKGKKKKLTSWRFASRE